MSKKEAILPTPFPGTTSVGGEEEEKPIEPTAMVAVDEGTKDHDNDHHDHEGQEEEEEEDDDEVVDLHIHARATTNNADRRSSSQDDRNSASQASIEQDESLAASMKSKQDEYDAELRKKDEAALIIQTMIRWKLIAPYRVKRRFFSIWLRVYDPRFRIYFWYSRLTKHTTWTRPFARVTPLYDKDEVKVAWLLTRVLRGFIGKMRARKAAHFKYKKYFDAKQGKFYWVNQQTQVASWNVPAWLIRQDVPMPSEDSLLYASQLKIRELEELLRKKDDEIKQARLIRFEELEPMVQRDKVAKARDLERSDHMDEWTMEQLCSWFEELKMGEHIPYLLANRVDGNLFINLADLDWPEMGIELRLHTRKLQLIMKAYRTRYIRKKAGISDEDADDLSEYSPSELSDLVNMEDGSDNESDDDDMEDGEDRRNEVGSQMSEEEMTPEQRLERQMDAKNIHIEVVVEGDELNYPMIGDVVRVRYNCTLVSNGKLIGSTKTQMFKPSVEFALGYGQVIKGFDRAIPRMSIGERSKLTISPEYAYGREGLFPNIPPDAELCFELTLLGFKARVIWVKPLVQEPGLNQRPYFEDDEEGEEAMVKTEELVVL